MSVILAAGDSTRMKSRKSKMLHRVAGLPVVEWVLRAVSQVNTKKNIMVCGKAIDEIQELYGERAVFVEQKERLGSGHAVMCAKEHLAGFDGYTLIVAGDMPLLCGKTLTAMITMAEEQDCDCVLLSAVLENPFGYGRIVRGGNGEDVVAIVEEKDATDAQKAIKEMNASCYCVKNSVLLDCLDKLQPNNVQQEYYLTDIVELINRNGGTVKAYTAADHSECMGINDRVQLAEVDGLLRSRINRRHQLNGVTIVNSANTYIDEDTMIGQDVVIYPGVTLENGCEIGEDVVLYPGSRISGSKIGNGTVVQNSVVLDAQVGEDCTVGPYAYLRPKSVIGDHCRVGDFVEVKNSTIGDGTKISHLTYVGDSDLGKNINIGCGVVFVNYDGKNKHRSTVEDDVFLGCNTNIVSPVTVGEGSYIAAGSTITKDIPPKSLAIARAREVIKENWKDKRDR